MKTQETIKTLDPKVSFLEAAIAVGNHLVSTAIWDLNRTQCNWLGRRDIVDKEIATHATRTSAMSPEFYSGSAGIAFFLMELYGVTQNKSYKQTALGGFKRSLAYLKTNDFPASPISFYAGDLGLLYTAYRFIEIEPDLEQSFQESIAYLTSKIETGLQVKHSLDVIGGNAGAIGPLFMLSDQENIPILAKIAADCANEIVDLAQWKEAICFWDSPKIHGVELDSPPLTGFSHGCSGIGLGLLKAYQNTGNEAYLKHGRGAFAFENALFNEDENNWIDTRYPHVKRDGKITGTFRSAWCHGAPGNVLAHMIAGKIDGEYQDFHFDRAARAVATTKKQLQQKMIDNPFKDATLCHGILGLSDILFSYGKEMQDDSSIEMALEVSQQYLGLFSNVVDMPSGITAGGYSPSIMTGIAGIGLHYLRLSSECHISSVLLIS